MAMSVLPAPGWQRDHNAHTPPELPVMDTTPKATQTERAELMARFNSYEPASLLLPIIFPSGYRLTNLAVSCPECQQRISQDCFRCQMVALLPKVYRVDGIGICRQCRRATIYMFRLRDADSFMIERINKHGHWVQYTSKPISGLRRILRSAAKLLRFTSRHNS